MVSLQTLPNSELDKKRLLSSCSASKEGQLSGLTGQMVPQLRDMSVVRMQPVVISKHTAQAQVPAS